MWARANVVFPLRKLGISSNHNSVQHPIVRKRGGWYVNAVMLKVVNTLSNVDGVGISRINRRCARK